MDHLIMSLFSIFVLTSLITLSGAQESSSHNVGQNVSEQVNSPTNENDTTTTTHVPNTTITVHAANETNITTDATTTTTESTDETSSTTEEPTITTSVPYFLKASNQLCTDGEIDSLDECKSAITYLNTSGSDIAFWKTESVQDHPKGCYKYKDSRWAFWNTHKSGAANKKVQPICTNEDDSYSIKVCDFYRDAWKDDKKEKWIVGKDITSPLFCAGNPFWYPAPYEPTCNKDWPIRVEFYDGSKYTNGTLITCTVNMAESKNSSNTRDCLNKAVNGFDKVQKVDWIVYLTAGYNSRILWYHDFAEALINRYQNLNRRIVVAMIYWEEMANNVNSQQWYEDQIQLAINGYHKVGSRSLPHGQNWASRTTACLLSSYKQAATNVPVVGNIVGELVKYIRSDFAESGSYTTFCIGFSLGAHNCGFIGKSSNMVDKIVALDPAGAIFDNHPAEYRLAKGDAKVIHVFHTSSEFTGLVDPIGDVDFYPNGLWYNQPQTCPNESNVTCGCPSYHSFSNTPSKYFPFFTNNLDCSHMWGLEFLVRLWEKSSDNWYCNSTVYCTSMDGYFPHMISEVGVTKPGYNECYEGDAIQVGNLETMTQNDHGIRWFETEHSTNCKYVNTVQAASEWTEDFKPMINLEDYFTSK